MAGTNTGYLDLFSLPRLCVASTITRKVFLTILFIRSLS